jgi:hypothetical protein
MSTKHPKPKAPPTDTAPPTVAAGGLADAVLVHAAEVERLRGLIRSAVKMRMPGARCPLCLAVVPTRHDLECPWDALVAEAELGAEIDRERQGPAKTT